jgi:hypothetical protein
MTATSKNFVAVTDAQVDADSPIDVTLITSFRDSLVHLREWLGASFTGGAVQDHNHDGVNSAAIEVGPNLLRNGSFENGTVGWTLTPFTGGTMAAGASNNLDGANALAVTSTSTANGGGDATGSAFVSMAGALRNMAFSLAVKASVANVSSKAEVVWYDNAQAQISISTIYTSTNTPTTSALQSANIAPPSTARYFKVKLTGGVPASGSAFGTIYFDGVSATSSMPCTYLGSLVEVGAIQTRSWINDGGGSPIETNPGSSTVDMGADRAQVGIRQLVSSYGLIGGSISIYVRGQSMQGNS